MRIHYISDAGAVSVLVEGEDRSINKRCGPYDFGGPISWLGQDTPCIDAEHMVPESRGNKSRRISFGVSIQFASDAAALIFCARQAENIPMNGTLLLLNSYSDQTGVRIVNCRVVEVDPRQSGVSVDVRYTFIGGQSIIYSGPA